MIVAEFDVFGAPVFPAKTHAPPGIDAYAVLSLTVAFQGLTK